MSSGWSEHYDVQRVERREYAITIVGGATGLSYSRLPTNYSGGGERMRHASIRSARRRSPTSLGWWVWGWKGSRGGRGAALIGDLVDNGLFNSLSGRALPQSVMVRRMRWGLWPPRAATSVRRG